MKLKRVILILTLIELSIFSIWAQTQSLTIEQAVELALQQNTSLEQSKITLDALKRANSHSWNSISPSLSLSGTYSQPNDTSSYDWRLSGSAGVSLSFSAGLFTSIKTAKLNYENGLISYEEACRSIELSVRTSFYSLLYEQEYINLQNRQLETSKETYDQNVVKYRNGRISELDVLSAQVAYEQLKPNVEDAIISFTNNVETFKQLLNLDPNVELTLEGSLDDIQKLVDVKIENVDAKELIKQSTTIRTLEKQLAAAKTAVTASRVSAYGPTVTAGWTYQPSLTSESDGKTTDGGALSLGVSIPLDGILPWSTKADTVASAKDSVSTLELQLDNAKRSAEVSANNYLRQIQQTQSSVKSLQINETLAQRTYEMTLDAYNRGTKDYLTLQSASDSLFEARLSVKSKLYTLISNILNLENTTGVQFGTLVQ